MATLDELIIRIEANTAQLRREMKRGADSVERNTRRMDRSLRKSDKAFARLNKSASRARAAIVGLVAAVGLSRVFGAAKEDTIAFAKALADLSAITGAVGGDLKKLENAARSAQATTTKSAVDFLQAAKLIASAKPELLENADALAAITREAVTLSEAAQIDLPVAASALATALNQFNAPAEEAGRFINALAAGSKLASAEIPALVQAMEIAGPAFAQANIPFEEFIALVGRFAASGIPIEQFATQFRNIILKLGTTADNTNPAIVGLFEALRNLEKEGLSATESLRRFEIRGATVVKEMFEITDSAEQLAAAINGTNIAYEQAGVQTADLAGATERLDNAWKSFNITLGKSGGLLESYIRLQTQFAKGLTFALDRFSEFNNQQNQTLLGTLGLGRQESLNDFLGKPVIGPGAGDRARIIEELVTRGVKIPVSFLFPGEQNLVTATKARFFPSSQTGSKLKEIPVTSRSGGSVTPFLDVTPQFKAGPGGPLENLSERDEQIRADTKKLLDQINQDFLRATGRDAEAIVAIFAVRKTEVEKLLRLGKRSEEEIQTVLSQLDTIRDAAVMGLDASAEAAERFGDAMNFALQNAILQGERLDKVLIRMLKSAVLFGVDGKSGLLGGILGTVTGSLSKVFTIPGFSHGGDPRVGVPRIVGESGPEIEIPRVPTTIISNMDSRRLLGGPNVTVNNFQTFNPGMSNVEQAAVRNFQIAMGLQNQQQFIDAQNGIRR